MNQAMFMFGMIIAIRLYSLTTELGMDDPKWWAYSFFGGVGLGMVWVALT